MLEMISLEVVWDGTKSHNGGLLMAAEETKMKKELITKGEDGWGFETLDGRRAGFPSRDAARLARKEWMEAPQEKQEEEMQVIAAKDVHPVAVNGTPAPIPTAADLGKQLAADRKGLTLTGRKRVTADEVTAVLNLRAAGMSFQRIEAELGWDDHHGCKARRIVQDAAAAHALATKNDAKA